VEMADQSIEIIEDDPGDPPPAPLLALPAPQAHLRPLVPAARAPCSPPAACPPPTRPCPPAHPSSAAQNRQCQRPDACGPHCRLGTPHQDEIQPLSSENVEQVIQHTSFMHFREEK
jgi:hypothetical protein